MRKLILAACLVLSAALTACVEGRGGNIAYNPSDFGRPDAPKVATLGDDYRIAPLDTLAIKVFRMADLSGDYEVDLTGKISMPLIGDIAAADLTSSELDRVLTERFGAKYLENPDISVGIKSSTRRVVTVDGAVKATGSYPVSGPMTLMQAVALAGGTTDDANPRRVAIFRTIGGKRTAAAFDLAAIRKGASDPAIYAGDIVVVDGSRIKALQKQILTNLPFISFLPL